MAENLNPNIFLSYAWANANIADEIDNDFKSIGIQFKRDVRDLEYRTSIKEFMQQIGKSDFVLMIISDEYLKSLNCMYEVTELLNTHEFEKRILPIVIDNATKIFKPSQRTMYYDFWKQEHEEAEKNKKTHTNRDTVEHTLRCQRIYDNLPEFFQRITDLNVSSYENIKRGNYRELLKITGFKDNALLEEIMRIADVGDDEEKEIQLDLFLRKHPINEYALFSKAYLANETGHYKKAKHYYEDLIAIHPNSVGAHNNLAVLLENSFLDLKNAKVHYNAALKIDPKHAITHYNLALLHEIHFLDFEKSKLHYKAALKIDPWYADAHNNLGLLFQCHLSDFNNAKLHYQEALKINPKKANTHNNLATLLQNQFSDFENARFHYQEALKINSKYDDAHYNFAILLSDFLTEFKKAKQHYEEALKINPKHVKAHYNLAILLKKQFSDFEGAKQHYEMALEIDPDFTAAKNSLNLLFEQYFKK